jgi:hypothetical protein
MELGLLLTLSKTISLFFEKKKELYEDYYRNPFCVNEIGSCVAVGD